MKSLNTYLLVRYCRLPSLKFPSHLGDSYFVFFILNSCFFSIAFYYYLPHSSYSYCVWFIWLVTPSQLEGKLHKDFRPFRPWLFPSTVTGSSNNCGTKNKITDNDLKLQILILTNLTEGKRHCRRIRELLNIRLWFPKDPSKIFFKNV